MAPLLTLIAVGCTLPYLGLGRRNLSLKDAVEAGLMPHGPTDIFMPAKSSDEPSVTMWPINQQENTVERFQSKAGSEAMRPGLGLHIQTQEKDLSALCEDGNRGTTCKKNQMAVTRLYTGEVVDLPPNQFIKGENDVYYTYQCAYKMADTAECEWNLPSEDDDAERTALHWPGVQPTPLCSTEHSDDDAERGVCRKLRKVCPCGKADDSGSIDVIAKVIFEEYASANQIDLELENNIEERTKVKAHAKQLAFRAAYASGQFFVQPVQTAVWNLPGADSTEAKKTMPYMGLSAAKKTRADGFQVASTGSAWSTIFIGPPQRAAGDEPTVSDKMPTVMTLSKRILQCPNCGCKACKQLGLAGLFANKEGCDCYAICLSIPIKGVDREDYQRTMVTISNAESIYATDPLRDPNQCKNVR